MSVGLLAVRLKYGLYVVVHLSKLAFHFMFKVVCLVVGVSSVTLAYNNSIKEHVASGSISFISALYASYIAL